MKIYFFTEYRKTQVKVKNGKYGLLSLFQIKFQKVALFFFFYLLQAALLPMTVEFFGHLLVIFYFLLFTDYFYSLHGALYSFLVSMVWGF